MFEGDKRMRIKMLSFLVPSILLFLGMSACGCARGQMLISYNRGAIIVKGMPKGFYEGYDSEIHEVFLFNIKEQ